MTTLERARLRQEQQNDLIAAQEAELARLDRRHGEARAHLVAAQQSERAIVKVRHQRELATLWQAQGRQLGPGMQRHLETGGQNGKAR
jgi:hypothetical protein